MRLNSLESANREMSVSRRIQDASTSGIDMASGMGGLCMLPDSLSSSSGFFPKTRARLKKRIRICSMDSGRIFKRGMDVCGSLAAIILLLPLFLAVAVWLKLDSPGPLFFRQVRIGLHGRPFYFYKFRSMYIDSEARRAALEKTNESKDGVIFKMKNDPRITRCGRFIRKYSIDEAPQFFNVLLGDMSLVGPRPPLPAEVAQYSLDDRKRLDILPGITCIWQISGRSDIPFREQVVLDKEYIRGQGFWKDVLILFKTVPAVLTGKGAY
jgi:lipopolysaccharide/colanic/teichoic acid biosynthesis glycosyltransferase